MRPCAFQSRIVASCVVTPTRLCTCIRSMRFVCNRANERSIDSIPGCWPRVQTFVARKTESRTPSLATKSPITSSERPYMGDESITRAPSFTNAERVSSSCLIATDAGSMSNVCQVPSPITGSFSPNDGIARISIADDLLFVCARTALNGNKSPAVVPPIKRAASRRVIEFIFSLVMSSVDASPARTETALIVF